MDFAIILLLSLIVFSALMVVVVIVSVESAKQTIRNEIRKHQENTIDVTPKNRR